MKVGGYRLKPDNLRSWLRTIRVLSDFLVLRNVYHVYIRRIKWIIFNKYVNTYPVWKRRYPTGVWESRVCAPIIDIMIILFTRPDDVTSTPTNGIAVLLSRASNCITWPVIGVVLVTWYKHIFYIYVRFGIILTQLYVNYSRQEHQIDDLSFNSWDSQVSAPFISPFQSL